MLTSHRDLMLPDQAIANREILVGFSLKCGGPTGAAWKHDMTVLTIDANFIP